MIRPHARVLVALSGLLVALGTLAGCDRKPRLVPESSDSGRIRADSFAVYARRAGEQWDAGEDDAAAGLTAQVVHEALRARPSEPWAERARSVLDSLGFAAEVAGVDGVALVNLFSRSRPEGDSWPYLYWQEAAVFHMQSVEGRGLHLQDIATRGFDSSGSPIDTSQVAAVYTRRAGGGTQPMLLVWRRAGGGRWDLLQTLGPDSLGGVGTAEFTSGDTDIEVTSRTFHSTPYFEECATCPHVYVLRHFRWTKQGFARADEQRVPSPYSTFTAFISALVNNDQERAMQVVADPTLVDFARRYAWNEAGLGRWRVAPATDEGAIEMVFFRGPSEAYRISFESRDGEYVVSGFEATQRSVE
ncbi:MAG: hypothetical protein ABIU54_04970 [Candidatus Eisenbacteria bacterium]